MATSKIKSDFTFPLISEMTTPTIRDSRAKNVVGGYKQVGKTVYIDLRFDVNVAITYGAILPETSYYVFFDGVPAAKNSFSPLYITGMGSVRPYALFTHIRNEMNNIASIPICMAQTNSQGSSLPVDTSIHIRGTYEAE